MEIRLRRRAGLDNQTSFDSCAFWYVIRLEQSSPVLFLQSCSYRQSLSRTARPTNWQLKNPIRISQTGTCERIHPVSVRASIPVSENEECSASRPRIHRLISRVRSHFNLGLKHSRNPSAMIRSECLGEYRTPAGGRYGHDRRRASGKNRVLRIPDDAVLSSCSPRQYLSRVGYRPVTKGRKDDGAHPLCVRNGPSPKLPRTSASTMSTHARSRLRLYEDRFLNRQHSTVYGDPAN